MYSVVGVAVATEEAAATRSTKSEENWSSGLKDPRKLKELVDQDRAREVENADLVRNWSPVEESSDKKHAQRQTVD